MELIWFVLTPQIYQFIMEELWMGAAEFVEVCIRKSSEKFASRNFLN